MRFLHSDGTLVHAAYCTNVHQAEDLDGVLGQLGRFAEPVREALDVPVLGLGLWLSCDVAHALAGDASLTARLRAELAARGLEVVTLNAFPYRGFHDPVVKQAVYHPDWTDRRRLDYTLDAATVLAGLLPGDAVRGSVSTLPLAWRDPWDTDRARRAELLLGELAAGLGELERRTGRTVRVGLEPEPGCVVETTTDAVRHLGFLDPERVGICLDVCHLAVQFEEPAAALARLDAAGLPVVKTQASCALHVEDPGDPAAREVLAAFHEPRFLHQTRRSGTGTDDLDEALGGLDGGAPWRVHFHLPLHAEPAAPLASTRSVLGEALDVLLGGPAAQVDHVEVETYTWQVLPHPPGDDAALVAGLAAELDWTRSRLTGLGLKEIR
ncbi:metabolite traffic protein EboE [Actinocorallia longicatena]|uniref:Metabolite traffic protein EboE n=1 Tax=Actinocorallia longicatena TaxID=111803 RepID=A0ABP6QNL1_9ACTN